MPQPKSLAEHIKSHQPQAIRQRLQDGAHSSYLRDFVYGAIDGTVTTFAIVSAVAGAGFDSGIVIVMGIANLLGDGFSMAASNYLGIRAEQQQKQSLRRMEEMHIERYPEGEKEEIREIFRQKGFEGNDLERVVEVITADVNQWVDTMLTDEFGVALEGPNPLKAAFTTFAAFVLVGSLPLLAFAYQWLSPIGLENPYLWSTVITSGAFFAVGAAKSWFITLPWYREGLETLLVGSMAAGLAYLAGAMFSGVAV
ncbi:MAG: VIT1/CCC1 transporter family protein [Planctomycetales bacterium]|nr:VIT1/CCC1 transporter family protein [Planctomycetales bacterium]